MKKKLLILLILLIVPFMVVKADMGLPTTGDYDVYVTNPEGAKVYDYEGSLVYTIPQGTIVTIMDESYKDGKFWGRVYEEFDTTVISGNVNLDDVELVKTDVEFEGREDWEWHSEEGTLYVVADKLDIYKGPAYKYGKLEGSYTIKAGETIPYNYVAGNWVYVNYKDIQGWIKKYDNSQVAYKGKSLSVFLVKDVQMYTSLELDTPIEGAIIPKYTEISFTVSKFEYADTIALVEYNGTKGWIYVQSRSGIINGATETTGYGNQLNVYKLLSNDSLPVYSDFDCTNIIGYINYNDEFKFKYNYINHEDAQGYDENAPVAFKLYVNEDNLKGWINLNENEPLFATKVNDKIFVLEEMNIYDLPDGKGTVIGTTKINKVYTVTYDLTYNWIYIENGEASGWINKQEATAIGSPSNFTLVLEEDVELYDTVFPGKKESLGKSITKGIELIPLFRTSLYNNGTYETWYYVEYNGTKGWFSTDKATEIEVPVEPDISEKEKPHIIKEEKSHLNKLEIALIAVGSAVAIAATAVVTIVLVKKKKNKKVVTLDINNEDAEKAKQKNK